MSTLIYTESALDPADAIYDFTLPAGDGWMHEIKRGQTFRIVDLEGNQAADTLFYNAHDMSDRYTAQDTIRAQSAIYLTTGTKLMSGEGNVLLTITADTCGRHDTLGGACATESNQVRYALDKRWMHACRDTFMLQVHALGPRRVEGGHHAQHQLFHERARDARRRAVLRRRRERGWPVRGDARGDGRDRAHLELPAAQQSLQRL